MILSLARPELRVVTFTTCTDWRLSLHSPACVGMHHHHQASSQLSSSLHPLEIPILSIPWIGKGANIPWSASAVSCQHRQHIYCLGWCCPYNWYMVLAYRKWYLLVGGQGAYTTVNLLFTISKIVHGSAVQHCPVFHFPPFLQKTVKLKRN